MINTDLPFFLGGVRVAPACNDIGGVRVECKSMDVLMALVCSAPAIVSAEKLLACVWARSVVVDNVVYQAITQLRRALGDDAHDPRFIETIPRRGYRLIADVRAQHGGDPVSGPKALAALVVFPFTYRGSEPDGCPLATELTERVIDCVASTRRCAVRVKTLCGDVSGSAIRDGARWWLNGFLSMRGDDVLIRAALVDASAHDHLWGAHYLAARDRIAEAARTLARDAVGELSSFLGTPSVEFQHSSSTRAAKPFRVFSA